MPVLEIEREARVAGLLGHGPARGWPGGPY
jgi:hypothetical protein